MNKLICIVFTLILAGSAAAESSTQEYCREVQRYAREVIDQLPMRMDAATTWTEISAIYSGGVCRVYHRYLLDSRVLVKSVARHQQGSTESDVIDWYRTAEGMARLKAVIRESVTRRIPEMMSIPNVVYQADYSSQGPLDSFTVEIETGG
jgi:hypothetical protein